MSLSQQDAIEIAWSAFLDEVGEPFTPDWRQYRLLAFISCRGSRIDPTDEYWRVVFIEKAMAPCSDAGRVWVDKLTGHCNVWINENFEPEPVDPADRPAWWDRHLRARASLPKPGPPPPAASAPWTTSPRGTA